MDRDSGVSDALCNHHPAHDTGTSSPYHETTADPTLTAPSPFLTCSKSLNMRLVDVNQLTKNRIYGLR